MRICQFIFHFTILSILNFFPHLAFAGSAQTYRIGWYSKDAVVCEQHADIVAQRFESATGLPVLVAGCERRFGLDLDLVVQYQADEPIEPVSTFDQYGEDQGMFATKQDCDRYLAAERKLFEQKTGLSAIVGFCFARVKPSQENPNPFTMRIDGFGKPKIRPFVVTKKIYEKGDQNPANIASQLQQSISTNPSVSNAVAFFDRSGDQNRFFVKYYASRKQSFNVDTFATFENIAVCRARKASIDAIFSEFGVVGSNSFCASEEFDKSSPLYSFGTILGAYSLERIPRIFQNRGQCESEMPGIVNRYAESSGSSLVKGFCSYEKQEVFSSYNFVPKILIQQ